MALFTGKERVQAEAIADLNYTNPFLAERVDLVKQILGDDFIDHGRVWSEVPGLDTLGNVAKVSQITDRLTRAAFESIRQGAELDKAELKLYEGLVVYFLYDRCRERLAELIREPEELSSETSFIYDSFKEDFSSYLVLPRGIKLPSDYRPDHLFAMYFQIQRAFYHIFDFLIGSSMASAELRAAIWHSIFTHDIHRYQRSLYNQMNDVTTLITGPSGTGKELVARAISYSRYIPYSVRKKCFVEDFRTQFFALHLSAMSSNLIESELFGRRKGAYTGALDDHAGWLEGASEYGTVFLDEIGEVSEAIQVKLLRLLQNRTFQRLGETSERKFKGKVIAATNRDLGNAIQQGGFRSDLFYRLCSDQIRTPSLREQLSGGKKELQDMVRYLSVKIIGREEGEALATETTAWIIKNLGLEYDWPGNVRELEQCIRNIMIRGYYTPPERIQRPSQECLAELLEQGELTADELLSQYCQLVYQRTGSYVETARRLGLDRRTVKAKVG